MEQISECVIPLEHPALAGHFPGRSVVPGVVILDEVVKLAQCAIVYGRVAGVDGVKFLHPLLPQQPFTIFLTGERAGRWRFDCRVDDARIAHGTLIIAGAD